MTATMVLVLDQNFQVAWVWDSFNWLNTSRLGTDGEGPDDWLHANSISWSPEDGDLIVSLRAQDWVIKIDYDDGTGDGHIVWTLGAGRQFHHHFLRTRSPWFSHQHDVTYINDNTLVLFDDGNTRRLTDPTADSRGQELVLNEQTMTATLVVNADLGNYSSALGSAQMLPNGNLAFTSGFQGAAPNTFGQTIEVLPDGSQTYVQEMTGMEYRSYFMSTLYGPLANLLEQDESTQGTWIGTYGTTGYDVIGGRVSLPTYATVTPSGQSIYVWAASTTDPRALQVPGGGRVAAAWYSRSSFSVDVDLTDGAEHRPRAVLRRLGQPGPGRDSADQRRGDGTSVEHAVDLVVHLRAVPGLHGHREHRDHDHQDGRAECRPERHLPRPGDHGDARQAGHDDAGDVDGHLRRHRVRRHRYHRQPAQLRLRHALGPVDLRLGRKHHRPPRLQVPGGGRIAATWYSLSSFRVNVNLADGAQHDLELYFDDWDSQGRVETVQISDAATGDVLSTQSISAFSSGLYLNYVVSGHIVITITRTAGPNAVLSGIFLDPVTAATLVKQDTTTQGTWIGTYGGTGNDVIGTTANLPSYASVTPSGQSTYVWAASTTDRRALQVPGGGRIAATWYSSSSFTVNVNLTDGEQHDLELYFDDWENQGRVETVQISDAATGEVLSTQSISAFSSGLYLDYVVSGHIVITITRTAGTNAVLSGIFLG